MENFKPPYAVATLDKFLGLYTEADPTSLPEGASPLSWNCDYEIAEVHQRPGKQSAYYFENEFSERICGFAQSLADPGTTDEVPWSNPINATKGIPGTYASVQLSTEIPTTDGVAGVLDGTPITGSGTGEPVVGTLTPSGDFDFVFALMDIASFVGGGVNPFTPDAGWTTFGGALFGQLIAGTTPVVAGGTVVNALGSWTGAACLLAMIGDNPPTEAQTQLTGTASLGSLGITRTFASPTTDKNTILVALNGPTGDTPAPTAEVTDDAAGGSNVYVSLGSTFLSAGINTTEVYMFAAFNAKPAQNITITPLTNTGQGPLTYSINELVAGALAPPNDPISEQLQCLNFGFSIPAETGVLGFQVEVTGKQTNLDPSCTLVVKLLQPSLSSPTFTFQLPSVEGTVVEGTPTENWGLALTPDLLNNSNFGVEIQAFSPLGPCTFDISAVKIKAFLTPNPAPCFNYIKTFEEEDVFGYTLALDSSGVIWQEDFVNNPGALNSVFTGILPNSFAKSDTISLREFIAISNLINGTDIPYTYNGTNFDRCSQVGPGAAPTAAPASSGSTIDTITQNAAHTLPTGPHDWTLVSDSPRDIGDFGLPATPGNILTIITRSAFVVPPEITPGTNVVLSGFPTVNGFVIDNDPTGATAPPFYTIIAVGQPIPGQLSYDAFSVTVNFTTFYNQPTTGGCNYQSTTATLTAATQVPNLEVGGQMLIAGTGGSPPSGYDGTWTVLTTPNASQFAVTATRLNANLATYSYTLTSGTNPVAGQAVSVFQTLNGNGIFNVSNAIIQSASPGTFSINLTGANVPSAPENGAGIVFGTIFTFDPGGIVGNKSGGSVSTTGTFGAGTRQICYSYLTRNDYVTAPSPICTVTIPEGTGSITISNLLPGPSNVVARIIHLTPADGGQFYNIPEPVPIVTITGTVINDSTYVRDNTTTTVRLSFADGVLVGAIEIDVEGNNLFETIELGSCTSFVGYSDRAFALGEQNKVPNFLNWSFDGGIVVTQSQQGAGGGAGVNRNVPAGWNLDLTSGVGGDVVNSPVFGFAYQINNTTGSTQAAYGMITQPAFQDEFQVPIIEASTAYSVRVTASVPSGLAAGGNLVLDLFNPATATVVGAFSIPLASIALTQGIFTGDLLTQVLAPVPNGLLLRVWAQNIPNAVLVLVDRLEVFPTLQPVLSTQVTGSYIENYEAFDQLTGVIKATIQNQQPIHTAFTLLDNFYLVKTASMISTKDNGTGEPNTWETKQVSNKCGTTSIYGVDSGEDWAVIAGEPGLFEFDGGQPTKVSSEIQKLWNLINWQYGHTLWVENDVTNQRIMVGVPMKTLSTVRGKLTQNPWIPAGAIPDTMNPTTPNVVLMLNYKQLNTGSSMADRVGVHSSSFTGKLLATDVTRKWSVWSIQAPAAAYVTRPNGTHQLFLGNSAFTGKIYELVEDFREDDGVAIDQRYITYPFPSGEQAAQLQMAGVQKQYIFMRLNIDGEGPLRFVVYPNSLDSPYMHALLPDLTLPVVGRGNLEVPVHETGERLFIELRMNQLGAAYQLSELNLALKQHTMMPVRGRN